MPHDCPQCAHVAASDWARVRTAMEHENGLTNQRVTWVLQSQGLLFAAYGLLTGKVIDLLYLRTPQMLAAETATIPIQLLMAVICVVGIFICALLTSGVKAAQTQHAQLERWWKDLSGHDANAHPPICGEEPRLGWTFHYYHLPALFIPTWILFLAGIWWDTIHDVVNNWYTIAAVGTLVYTVLIIVIYKIYQKSALTAESSGEGDRIRARHT